VTDAHNGLPLRLIALTDRPTAAFWRISTDAAGGIC
jgi:hypothetical protein